MTHYPHVGSRELTALRRAKREEYPRVRAAYAKWGYAGTALNSDVIFTAWSDTDIIGIVRRAVEQGHTMLRGMHIDPAWRRQCIGSMLLDEFEAALPPGPCHCIPFSYLEGFYGQIGFVKIPEADAPPHLIERLAQYRAMGRDMIVMRRDGTSRLPHR